MLKVKARQQIFPLKSHNLKPAKNSTYINETAVRNIYRNLDVNICIYKHQEMFGIGQGDSNLGNEKNKSYMTDLM